MTKNMDVHKVFAGYFEGAAAVAYAVSLALAEGSICLDLKQYIKEMAENELPAEVNPFWTDAEDFRKQMEEGRFVTHDTRILKPFIVEDGRVYLQRYYRYETSVIENIRRLGDKFRIITGGPGTGKTYGVGKELVKLFTENPDQTIALAAPTGKAAARMNESIRKFAGDEDNPIHPDIQQKLVSLNAQTLHRLLGYRHNSVFFRHNKENPLPFDVLVVDEASMVDGPMMAKLLDATGDPTILFLIGDKDQLASVEAGSVFGDMCRAKDCELLEGKVEVKVENWRAKDFPQIIALSEKIIAGDADYVLSLSSNKEVVTDTGYTETLFKENAALYLDYINEPDIAKALEKLDNIRFLCVTREHDHSVAETNQKIRGYLRSKVNDSQLFSPRSGFYHNQPIIITQNDYELGVNNGDVGLIRQDPEDGNLYAYFPSMEEGIKKIQAGYLNHYDTVFAMTIHKSQGSDFKNVVVLLPEKRGGKLLTRELLYTGVTRAKEQVLVQATAGVLEKCIAASVNRASGLTQRIEKENL